MIGKSNYGGFLRDYGSGSYEWDIKSGSENNVYATIPTFSQWHFLVGTYDGSIQRLYVDGELKSSQSLSVNPATTNDFGIAACLFCGPSQFAKATIDDLRIYNRALTAAEIQAIYDATK